MNSLVFSLRSSPPFSCRTILARLAMLVEKPYTSPEKGSGGDGESVQAVNVDESTVADWTEEEERAVKRK